MSTESAHEFITKLEELITSQVPNSTPASALQALGTPCVSIAVLTTDGIITHTIANDSSPTSSETLFQACSISKPLCGLAVLRTIEQGMLSHDDPITKHLPAEYVNAVSTPATRKLLNHLTIRHLISHTGGTTVSGFPGYDCRGPVPSVKTVLAGGTGSNTPQIRLSRFPGLRWRYSGGGTTILQVVLETIHKKPLPDIVQELVFGPLSMTRSFYNDSFPKGETNFAQCWNTGVTETTPARWHVQPELGAAGVWTTPGDLLKAQRGIRDAALGRNDFLSKDLAIKGLTAVDGAGGFTYGGWMAAKGWFGHGGSNNPGYRCHTTTCYKYEDKGELGAAQDEGIAVMTNSSLGTDVSHKIIQAIAYLRGWPGRDIVKLDDGGNQWIPLTDENCRPDEKWKEWKGQWDVVVKDDDDDVKKGQTIEISEDEEGMPCVKLDDLPSMRLLKAAMATAKYGKEKMNGMDLVVEGLDMMLAFGYDDEGGKTLLIWPGFWEDHMECKRK